MYSLTRVTAIGYMLVYRNVVPAAKYSIDFPCKFVYRVKWFSFVNKSIYIFFFFSAGREFNIFLDALFLIIQQFGLHMLHHRIWKSTLRA